jgi:hypothetical protein
MGFKTYLDQAAGQIREKMTARQQERERELDLLPPDLTGQVYLACRKEARRIQHRIDALQKHIDELVPAYQAARQKEQAASTPIYRPGRKRKHDPLFDDGPPEPVEPVLMGYVKTPPAVAVFKKETKPLYDQLTACKEEILWRNQELAELRKIVNAAGLGTQVLINHFSNKWRGRLEIGGAGGVLAKLSKAAVYTDSMGNPLPPEALDADGEPDIPPRGKPGA